MKFQLYVFLRYFLNSIFCNYRDKVRFGKIKISLQDASNDHLITTFQFV